jgi:FOG: CheY-like receiver
MSNLHEEHDVLLAEDDMDDVEIFGWALKEAEIPHSLRHAEDGDRLFVLLKEKVPYILFLDIKMPCKDGISCIKEIRKNPDYDNLPVVMYSSHVRTDYIDAAYRSSANYYLPKVSSVKETVVHLKRIFSVDWRSYQHYPVREEFVLR